MSIYFQFSFTKCGHLYIAATPVYGSRNNTETRLTNFSYENTNLSLDYVSSYQIKNSLNQSNLPTYFSHLYVNTPSKIIEFNMTKFPYDNLIYKVYITTENCFQYYPILSDNLSVAVIEMKTMKKRSKNSTAFKNFINFFKRAIKYIQY